MASGADVRNGPVGALIHRCSPCQGGGPGLQPCTGCHVIRYCCREHQMADIDGHMQTCHKISMARAKLDHEDKLIRKPNPMYRVPSNVFETGVGYFWEIPRTRPYMRARLALVMENLLPLGTLDSVREAHDHLGDMLRLCRMDTMAVREILPCIMLRLDRDQECYDFLKWWAMCDIDHDWDDFTLPYLDIHGADALEQPGLFIDKRPSLNYLVAVLILKLKLLVDVLNTKITRKVLAQRSIPTELHAQIQQTVVRSPLSADLYKHSHKALSETEQTLLTQICKLAVAITELNPYFMFDLFDPDEAMVATLGTYSPGSVEETDRAIQYSYATWWSTQGVLGLLESARDCAARASEGEIGELMAGDRFRKGAGSHRTPEQVLWDVSVNRLWGYLDFAIMDATYLGPWEERPSEVGIKMETEWDMELDQESESEWEGFSE
ncbi:unnamed protein product [Clonostachys solani]|uniref:MYND-type domain-containing protein n=1 Tax=Clonostachys solani TaxID=160281 RepID=A0A9P0ENI5_9HYPO|nr:unnamed protein product [Clonostachys solani]